MFRIRIPNTYPDPRGQLKDSTRIWINLDILGSLKKYVVYTEGLIRFGCSLSPDPDPKLKTDLTESGTLLSYMFGL
jgi:hypothetical protein